MNNSKDFNRYIELYQNFLNPNPNITYKTIIILKREFRVTFMNNLLNNLKEKDLTIRRKSILALAEYGEDVFDSIVPLYINSKNIIVKVSCLKTIIRVIVQLNLRQLNQEVMKVVDLAIKDNSPEITLSVVSLLRQLGISGRDILIEACKDKDLLRAKASISALIEMKDQTVKNFFDELLNDKSIDQMIKEDILKEKII